MVFIYTALYLSLYHVLLGNKSNKSNRITRTSNSWWRNINANKIWTMTLKLFLLFFIVGASRIGIQSTNQITKQVN